MEWLQVVIAAVVGLAGSSPVWAPWLIKVITGRAESDRASRQDLEAQRVRFEQSKQERIDNLVGQLDKREEKLIVLAERASAALAREEAMKTGISVQVEAVTKMIDGQRVAMIKNINDMTAEIATLKAEIIGLKIDLAKALQARESRESHTAEDKAEGLLKVAEVAARGVMNTAVIEADKKAGR